MSHELPHDSNNSSESALFAALADVEAAMQREVTAANVVAPNMRRLHRVLRHLGGRHQVQHPQLRPVGIEAVEADVLVRVGALAHPLPHLDLRVREHAAHPQLRPHGFAVGVALAPPVPHERQRPRTLPSLIHRPGVLSEQGSHHKDQ